MLRPSFVVYAAVVRSRPMTLFERIVGKESAFKRELRRYVPSEGWITISNIATQITPALKPLVNRTVLEEVYQSLPDLVYKPSQQQGEGEGDTLVCRKVWLEHLRQHRGQEDTMVTEGAPRSLTSEDDLITAVSPYLPNHVYVPLRAIARNLPFDIITSVRQSRFLFLPNHPDKFDVAHCLDDNCIVAKRVPLYTTTDGVDYFPNMYYEYEHDPDLMMKLALVLPSMRGINEIDSLKRLPINLRRDLRSKGYSLTCLCAMHEELFEVVRMDDDNFSVFIRSLVSDPETTDPETSRQRDSDLELLFEQQRDELLKPCTQITTHNAFSPLDVESFISTALKLHAGRRIVYAHKIGHVASDVVEHTLMKHLPKDPQEKMEYDSLMKKLPQRIAKQLSFVQGGCRAFLRARPQYFAIETDPKNPMNLKVGRGVVQLPHSAAFEAEEDAQSKLDEMNQVKSGEEGEGEEGWRRWWWRSPSNGHLARRCLRHPDTWGSAHRP
eukprot:PhF_6_TR26108/c1_g1_i1/m.36920